TVRVRGLTETIRACDHAGKEVKRFVRDELREVGNIVRVDATHKFEAYDVRSAEGYRTVVRQRGVSVEQSLRKVTGKHPEYGAFQMQKALLPALAENEVTVERKMEAAINKVTVLFEE